MVRGRTRRGLLGRLVSTVVVAAAALAALSPPASAVISFQPEGPLYPTGADPYTLAAGDINGDGRDDLLTMNGTSGDVSVYLREVGGFGLDQTISVGAGPNYAAIADADGDGDKDIMVANFTSGTISTLLQGNAGTFTAETPFVVPAGTPSDVVATNIDLPAGPPELLVTSYFGDAFYVLGRNGTNNGWTVRETYSQAASPTLQFNRPRRVAIANVGYTSLPDAAVLSEDGDWITILIRIENPGFPPGSYALTGTFPTGDRPLAIAAADFDGDGDADLATSNYNAGTVTIYTSNHPTYTQAVGSPISVGAGANGLAAGDFDNDNRVDLAVATEGPDRIQILRNTAGGWVKEPTAGLPTMADPAGLVAGRFDPDLQTDLATTSYALDRLQVFQNTTAGQPANTARPQVTGVPQVGQTLTCSLGTWSNAPTSFTRVWERAPRGTVSDSSPAWAPIDGATGTTYTVQQADAGSRVHCRVDASNPAGSATAFSASLRTDFGPPTNTVAPTVTGSPISGQTLTCVPGEWQQGPDFGYQWLKEGRPIAGATGATYVPTRSRDGGTFINADADGGRDISCQVVGTNDIGASSPVRATNSLHIVDGVPFNATAPRASIDLTRANAIGRTVSCDAGAWYDDYTRFGPPYRYEYQWFRNAEAIAGAIDAVYRTTADDLGKDLSCSVTTSNPAGLSAPARSNAVLAPLPPGTAGGQMYKTGGENEFDPVNLMALSGEYLAAVKALTLERLGDAVEAERRACRNRSGIPSTAPSGTSVKAPVSTTTRCAILLHAPASEVQVGEAPISRGGGIGVRYVADGCIVANPAATTRNICADLGFVVPPIDPTKPPSLDPAVAARLELVTPDRVLWDLDGDGRTDASCPGTAPVLRTMVSRGQWRPRAVLVARDSDESGVFGGAVTSFAHPDSKATGKGAVRDAQPFVCRTSLEPPPKADLGPCVTDGAIGRVHIVGNLCPLSVRSLPQSEIDNLRTKDPELYEVLTKMAAALALHRAKDDRVLVEPEPLAAARGFSNLTLASRTISATYFNTSSSLTAFGTGRDVSLVSALRKDTIKRFANIAKFNDQKANFALDQIYIARDALKANGVTIDPLGDSLALLIPSDVREAITPIKEMTLSARNASRSLGNLPLAAQEQLQAQFRDVASQAEAALPKVNLDQLRSDLAKKLDLGPFKLAGTADIKLENDGTATLKAQANLPGLKTGPGGRPISVGITLRADLNGNVKLQGVRLQAPKAYLGGILLADMDLIYDNGLDVKGKLLFPPVNAGIAVNRFRLGPNGQFRELDVDYLAGSGQGIPIGSGVFITKLGGGLSLDPDEIRARATISVGPSTGGGCPTVGIEAGFLVHFAPAPFVVEATGEVLLACIPLLNIKFHADSTGYVSLAGTYDYNLGPIFARGGMGAAFKLPDWQAQVRGEIGVKLPLVGRVSEGGELVISNKGLAGCVKVDLGFLGDVAGGASVRFSNGRPPLHIFELIANLRLFTGCDLSAFKPLGNIATAAQAPSGSKSFAIAQGTRGVALSIEGAGDAPRIRLRSPSGKVLDFSQGEGAKLPEGTGFVIENEDRTVVLMGKPEAGRWTAEPVPGSPAVARVQKADILPAATVRGQVSGLGASRVLTYDVTQRPGQVVRLLEQAPNAVKLLKTITGGGRGSVRFTTSEATGAKRKIVAEVTQDGIPRETIDVATFTAPSPRVGRPAKVTVKRRGRGALVTWGSAPFAKSYEVTVTTGDGRRLLLTPRGARREVTVSRVARNEGLRIAVVAISATARRGPAGRASLSGSMRVGAVKKPKKR